MIRFIYYILLIFTVISCKNIQIKKDNLFQTSANDSVFYLNKQDIDNLNHTNFRDVFGNKILGYNKYVLKAIELIQKKFPDGGGYFIGLKADPPESPIGYNLKFMGSELLNAPRTSSYCSGASYTAFIESLNLILDSVSLDSIRCDAIRMQEWNGSRREDGVKLWGNWNADGYGSYDAMVSYTGIGIKINPEQARPGDFVNISWKSGIGHSVVFLGWYKENGQNFICYWSSQKSTNGISVTTANVDRIKDLVVVRIIHPEKILSFNPENKVQHTTGQNLDFLSN